MNGAPTASTYNVLLPDGRFTVVRSTECVPAGRVATCDRFCPSVESKTE